MLFDSGWFGREVIEVDGDTRTVEFDDDPALIGIVSVDELDRIKEEPKLGRRIGAFAKVPWQPGF